MNAPTKLDKKNVLTESNLISISEIFGPTIQGEGELIGSQTIFVRTAGCDFRCQWCDTGYAVLPSYENDWQSMDANTIFNKIEKLSDYQPMWVTLSGGNPAMHELSELIKLGQEKGYQFSMETQGSIAQPWFKDLDQLTFSPKPPSSGMSFKKRQLDRCLQTCNTKTDISFKFVIANNEDLIWAKNIADQYPEIPSFVQPCNTQAKLQADNTIKADNQSNNNPQQQMIDLIAATQSLNWHQVRILPQLHNWLWGDKRGV